MAKSSGKRGRPRKYGTAAAFRRAVDAYFAGITTHKKLQEWADTGERSNKGKIIYAQRDVIGMDGNPVYVEEYLTPPTISGLCLYLGISLDTWENYASAEKNPDHAPICAYARLRRAAYLEEQLLSRTKGISGVIFDLQNNHGWRERREVDLGKETRRSISAAADMTMEDKLALIQEMAAAACEDYPLPGEQSCEPG